MKSGSTEDLKRARVLRVDEEALLYVRHGGAAYVIRDATLGRVEAIFEPRRVLGGRQAELGSHQAALGSRQAALGARQARIAARQVAAAPARAGEFARQQVALGRQQDALGREQAALGREQDRLAREAEAKFCALVADALRRGVAQQVD